MNPYIGHDSQLYGIEEYRLTGGRADGMRMLRVNNGKGLELTISLDRCADISRLQCKGINMSYMSPCGYVRPEYYDSAGTGWLNSFTAGFLTTCGLQNVGSACVDNGESLPFHGSISNIPAEHVWWNEEEECLVVHAVIKDEVLFGAKLRLTREIKVKLMENSFEICDMIENTGDETQPFEILYHMNMGYPLLDEDSALNIPSAGVRPRDDRAAEGIDSWAQLLPPQPGFKEQCYYHKFDGDGRASLYQPKLGQGVEISFDSKELDGFTQWKMLGVRDYVLGLECGNCYPDGRDIMRSSGMLKFLSPGEKKAYRVGVRLY